MLLHSDSSLALISLRIDSFLPSHIYYYTYTRNIIKLQISKAQISTYTSFTYDNYNKRLFVAIFYTLDLKRITSRIMVRVHLDVTRPIQVTRGDNDGIKQRQCVARTLCDFEFHGHVGREVTVNGRRNGIEVCPYMVNICWVLYLFVIPLYVRVVNLDISKATDMDMDKVVLEYV